MTGGVYRGIGGLLLIIATLFSLTGAYGYQTHLGVRLVLILAGLLLYVSGAALYRRGKKLTAMSAQELLERDPRPPVLYLRAFKDDPVVSRPPYTGFSHLLSATSGEEEQIAEVLSELGPVIAIGRPGERLPELGAARMYVADDVWRQTVTDLMRKARLVVYRATDTQAFTWEVKRGGEILGPEKIVFLVPKDADYQRFRERADTLLPGRLPERELSKLKCGTLAGLVYFDSAWRSHFVTPKPPRFRVRIRKPVVPMLKMMLEPIYRQLGQPWSPPAVTWLMYAGCLVLLLVPLLFVAMIILAAMSSR